MPVLLFLMILLISSTVKAEEYKNYWIQLKNAADRCYRGFNADIDLEVGVSDYLSGEEATSGSTIGKAVLKIPLYSKSEKEKTIKEKRSFLKEGAELIQKIEDSYGNIKILKKMNLLLKKTVDIDGVKTGINILQNEIKISGFTNEITANKRKIEAMLLCGKK